MAEQSTHDVVNQTQSVGDLSPSDAPATTSTPDIKVSGDDKDDSAVEVDVAPTENGNHATSSSLKMEEPEDGSARSDTDTSRAEDGTVGDKTSDTKPLKKLASKPISFAKYSVPKVIAASAAAKATEKGTCPIVPYFGRKLTSTNLKLPLRLRPPCPSPKQVAHAWSQRLRTPFNPRRNPIRALRPTPCRCGTRTEVGSYSACNA